MLAHINLKYMISYEKSPVHKNYNFSLKSYMPL